ncbi:MAG TPA: Gfo/Idh/MocA family oxidoreductase, partial [Verrucomicrobiae bacterium]|nr:Gfo/Idh/MocA family oxidoreductase [Verrucomicrobiae bacterium]
MGSRKKNKVTGKVRYAVVGLGHIAQVAILPAFAHARNSSLEGLVSGTPEKLRLLSKKYSVGSTWSYEQYEECLSSGRIDAVFIALPNDLHKDYALRASAAGIHILSEKPLAVTAADCEKMTQAAARNGVKLMTAYRLHFEETNLRAAELVAAGKIGEPRFFNSCFSFQITDEDNIRLKRKRGGGTLYDIGIYCLNAARYIFGGEPIEVFAFSANNGEKRFREVDEMSACLLRFPGERLATFTSSFGSADSDYFEVVGTKGSLRVEPAFEYAGELAWKLKIGGKEQRKTFAARDQFGAEISYFSDCILRGRNPEPSGEEGMIDVRIIEALYES